MYSRTHNCGALRMSDKGLSVLISGWVHRIRNKGFIMWVDLRDRYGVTQIVFDEQRTPKDIFSKAQKLGREFVIQVRGTVIARESKNTQIATGNIEVLANDLNVINGSVTPPFTIEDHTDGGDELRMKYRYLDIRRAPLQQNLILRHQVAMAVRNYLSKAGFIEIETPYLIKSTPEGARDFVVPSRMNPQEFYALPQSPQTFKQLLMVGGMDKYFQIVKCFRDEDLRSDRQPEFTQIDCEMAFVDQEDVMHTFEKMIQHLILLVKGIEIHSFPRMTYQKAIKEYGSDKPDIRFDMKICELTELVKGKGFQIFEQPLVAGICAPQLNSYTRKDIDQLTKWIKRPQVGALGLVWVRCLEDGTFKSSVDKFYSQEDLKSWSVAMNAKSGDLILIMAGESNKTRQQLGTLRLHLGEILGFRNPEKFAPLWVVDFPLLEWDEETDRYHAMHHPFTSPKEEDVNLLDSAPEKVRANAYDMILNGNEIGGGSIRIHNSELQKQMFSLLGFKDDEAETQFGFLMEAFKYGAPPHGGIAFGFDRIVALMGGQESIRDFIAFPKNNSGRDLMIDAPSSIDSKQMEELHISLNKL